ncbi:MAG: hypothetical protein HYV07_08890 [Deltaproteobacteria bacterium]|nr:hypothetical protein [Deltaproteobacteria bacterium]
MASEGCALSTPRAVWIGCVALSIFAAIASCSAPAFAQTIRDKLTEAIVAFGRGNFALAKALLDEGEQLGPPREELALFRRQRGIVLEAGGDRVGAVEQFLSAFYFKNDVTLDGQEHRGEVLELFACARKLFDRGEREVGVRVRYAKFFDGPRWSCPADPSAEAPPSPPAVHSPTHSNPDLTQRPTLTVDPPNEGGLLSSPIFWVVAGVMVVGGAVAVGFAASSTEDPYAGTTGLVIDLGDRD